MTIQRDPRDTTEYYWRAYTYDRIDLKGWALTKAAEIDVGAGQPILAGLADDPDTTGLHSFSFTVNPEKFRLPTMISPATPVSASENVKLTTAGTSGYFGTLERNGGQGAYKITAMVAVPGNDPGQLNESALEAASTTYPDDIKALYLTPLPARMLETDGLQLEAKILAEAKSRRAVRHRQGRRARAAVVDLPLQHGRLRSSSARISASPSASPGSSRGSASTTPRRWRRSCADVDIPARIVEGFLPGDVDPRTGIETIQFSQAHAWVEVYFPGYGWVRFDPTSPSVSHAQVLPSGPPLASAAPRASTSFVPPASRDPRGERDEGPSGFILPTGRGGLGPLVGVGVPAPRGRRGGRVPGLAPRSARADQRRRRLRLGDPHRLALRVRPAARPDRLRVRHARWARCCRMSGRSSRPWHGPRSSRPMPGRSSVTPGIGKPAGRPEPAAGQPPAARVPPEGPAAPPLTSRVASPAARALRCGCDPRPSPRPPLRRRPPVRSRAGRGARSGCGRAGPAARPGARRS